MPPIKTEHDQLVNGLSLVPWNVLDQLTPEQLQALDKTGITRRPDKDGQKLPLRRHLV